MMVPSSSGRVRDEQQLCGDDSYKKGSFVNEEYGKELRMELPSPQKKSCF